MGQCNGKAACQACRTREAAEVAVRKAVPDVTLMVAHKAIHADGEAPWRCRLCEEMGKHTEEGIVSHLKSRHRIAPKDLLHDKSDGSIFAPYRE